MSIRKSIIVFFVSINTALYAQNTPLIPVEQFFKIADKGKLDLSPNGKYYSYVSKYENKQNVFIENIETGDAKRITSYTQNNVRTYYWFNDSLILIRIDNNGDENYHLNLININTLIEKDLTTKVLNGNLVQSGNNCIEYYLDKPNTIGYYNSGISYYGKQDANLRSKICDCSQKDKPKTTFTYEFDSKNRVVKMISLSGNGRHRQIDEFEYFN